MYPVSCPARRIFCPFLPITLDISSIGVRTKAFLSSSLMVTSLIVIELPNALLINNLGSWLHCITSIFSPRSSLTIPCILFPFCPTQAPTGSIFSLSRASTAILAFSPGIRTTFLNKMVLSEISGISRSNSRSKNFGDTRDTLMSGLLPLKSMDSTTALTVSPFLKNSSPIWFFLSRISSFPSSSRMITCERLV